METEQLGAETVVEITRADNYPPVQAVAPTVPAETATEPVTVTPTPAVISTPDLHAAIDVAATATLKATKSKLLKKPRLRGGKSQRGKLNKPDRRRRYAIVNPTPPRDIVFDTTIQDLAQFAHHISESFTADELAQLPVAKRFEMLLDVFGALDTARNRAIRNQDQSKTPPIFQNFNMQPTQLPTAKPVDSTVPTQSLADLEAEVMGHTD